MELLKAARALLLIGVMFAAMAFAFLNNRELVDVNLFWGSFQDAPMAWVVFVAFLFGALVGYAISLFALLELQGRVREMKRQRHRLEGELTTLRNLPLDDAEEAIPTGPGR